MILEEISLRESGVEWEFSRMTLEMLSLRDLMPGIISSARAFERIFKAISVLLDPLAAILYVGMAAGAGFFSLNGAPCQNLPWKLYKYHPYAS